MNSGMACTKNTVRVNYPSQNTLQGTQRLEDTTQADKDKDESPIPEHDAIAKRTLSPPKTQCPPKRMKEIAQRINPIDHHLASDDEEYKWQGIHIPPLRPILGGKTKTSPLYQNMML